MTDQPHTCALCAQPITKSEAWEYEKGTYPIRMPEHEKHRVHTRCISALTREALVAFARAPEDKRNSITIEI